MSRKKKLLRNMLTITVITILVYSSRSFYMSPMAAHKAAERNFHYGPSDIIHVEDFSGGKYFLGKYDRWISCSTIEKVWGPFWSYSGQITGIELETDKPITYTWSFSWGSPKYYSEVYGILHDQSIDKVDVHLMDGTVLTQNEFYEDMFLLHWDGQVEFDRIIAYDSSGTAVFQDQRTR